MTNGTYGPPPHVNRLEAETVTFTGGSGRFAGVSGVLTGAGHTVVVSVDPATSIAHRKATDKQIGTLTFPSKL